MGKLSNEANKQSSERLTRHRSGVCPEVGDVLCLSVDRRSKEGLSKKEIIRCLKRYVAREVYPHLRPGAR